MSDERSALIREVILGQIAPGEPVPRVRLLEQAARRLGVPPRQRSLLAEVARETRRLEEEGRLVDAGPEVYATRGPRAPSHS